jgi:type VI secretion system protein ImpG
LINLFEQRAEPIALNHSQSEYPLVADARRQGTREIYSINKVVVSDRSGHRRLASPFFASRSNGAEALYWQLRRRRLQVNDDSTDAMLAIVDGSFRPAMTDEFVVSVETLCFNRDLPARLPYGGGNPVLTAQSGPAAITAVRALTPFSPTLRLATGEGLLWRLVSHLLLNHLSLTGAEEGAETLREILRLYDYRDAAETRTLINAVTSITHRRATARVANGGLARGLDIHLEMDPRQIDTPNAFLFGAVFERFLAVYANLNSFTRLTLRLKGSSDPVKVWSARSGDRTVA